MVKKMREWLEDDIDGSPAAESVVFSYAGRDYTMDLSQRNIDKLETALRPFIECARTVGKSIRQAKVPTSTSETHYHRWWKNPPGASYSQKKELTVIRQQVRRWGKEQGYPLGDVGVIPDYVYLEWQAQHRVPVPTITYHEPAVRHRRIEDDPEPEPETPQPRSTDDDEDEDTQQALPVTVKGRARGGANTKRGAGRPKALRVAR